MKINIKVRLKNKLFWATFIPAVLTFIYSILGCFEVVPTFDQEWVMNVINVILTMLASVGVLIDPTTSGVGDSNQAMTYEEPKKD